MGQADLRQERRIWVGGVQKCSMKGSSQELSHVGQGGFFLSDDGHAPDIGCS